MNRDMDEDEDSLFGSPPPSPARGRSPPQETFTQGVVIGNAIPSKKVGGKNVGTIALPGSHMSCAELPANLPASRLSSSRSMSNHKLSNTAPPSICGMPTPAYAPVAVSQSFTRSAPSRTSSTASAIPSAPTSTKRRKTSKAKSLTPALRTPPIALPDPNEPTPTNFLRSQSSLLGLAGLVGCVKPSRLYAQGSPLPSQRLRSQPPVRGSTPNNPIVLDDDQDLPPAGDQFCYQLQHLDQLDPKILRSNVINSLVKEKNIFPVLESLIKLLGGTPHHPCSSHPPEPFARPYGHGIFNSQTNSPVIPLSTTGGSTIIAPTAPPLKRRKLKHVPAGAADWNVPFPFAAGEGPETYHDTWARERVKQLVAQLLGLVQDATKRAAIKTAKSKDKVQTRAQGGQSSRSASVETQGRKGSSTQATDASSSSEGTVMGRTPSDETSTDDLGHFLASLESSDVLGSSASSNTETPGESQSTTEELDSAASCDNSAFEEWLAQLQRFLPENNVSTPESDWGARSSGSPAPSTTQSVHVPAQCNASMTPHTMGDEAIDPALLAISQRAGLAYQSHSPAPPTPIPGGPEDLDHSPTPPPLSHSPRTSLSSLTEPLTPLSEVFSDILAGDATHQDRGHNSATLEEELCLQPTHRGLYSEESESPCITAAQKGKAQASVSVTATPFTPSRSTVSSVSTSKSSLDKQAILGRARERRNQLVAEIECTKKEAWAASIENAVLVHFTRNGLST